MYFTVVNKYKIWYWIKYDTYIISMYVCIVFYPVPDFILVYNCEIHWDPSLLTTFLNGSITMCFQRNIILYSVRQRNHFII